MILSASTTAGLSCSTSPSLGAKAGALLGRKGSSNNGFGDQLVVMAVRSIGEVNLLDRSVPRNRQIAPLRGTMDQQMIFPRFLKKIKRMVLGREPGRRGAGGTD